MFVYISFFAMSINFLEFFLYDMVKLNYLNDLNLTLNICFSERLGK